MKRKFILLPITLTALAPAISLVGCGLQPIDEIVVSWTKGQEFIPSIPAKEFAEGEGKFEELKDFYIAYHNDIMQNPMIYIEDILGNFLNVATSTLDAMKVSSPHITDIEEIGGGFRTSFTITLSGMLSQTQYLENRVMKFDNILIHVFYDGVDEQIHIGPTLNALSSDSIWSVDMPELTFIDDKPCFLDTNKTYNLEVLETLSGKAKSYIIKIITSFAAFQSEYFKNASVIE